MIHLPLRSRLRQLPKDIRVAICDKGSSTAHRMQSTVCAYFEFDRTRAIFSRSKPTVRCCDLRIFAVGCSKPMRVDKHWIQILAARCREKSKVASHDFETQGRHQLASSQSSLSSTNTVRHSAPPPHSSHYRFGRVTFEANRVRHPYVA